MTAGEAVKQTYPEALPYKHPQVDLWVIGLPKPAGTNISGCRDSEAEAWADAAKRIQEPGA